MKKLFAVLLVLSASAFAADSVKSTAGPVVKTTGTVVKHIAGDVWAVGKGIGKDFYRAGKYEVKGVVYAGKAVGGQVKTVAVGKK